MLGEGGSHLVPKHLVQTGQQFLLRTRREHAQCLPVDVHHADLARAAFDEFGVHVEEGAKVLDALLAYAVDQLLDTAEVFDPQRHRRMFEQAACVLLAARDAGTCARALAHVFERDQDAAPVLFVAGDRRCVQGHVEPLSVQRVVDGLVTQPRPVFPHLHQVLGEAGVHVVAKHLVEIGDQVGQVACAEQFQRLAVHLEDADARGAGAGLFGVLAQVLADVAHARGAPGVQCQLELGIILEPERYGRHLEQLVVVGFDHAHGGPLRWLVRSHRSVVRDGDAGAYYAPRSRNRASPGTACSRAVAVSAAHPG